MHTAAIRVLQMLKCYSVKVPFLWEYVSNIFQMHRNIFEFGKIPLAQNDHKLDGYNTIFQLCLERIGFMGNFRAIRGFEFNVFDFIPVMLFDEGHDSSAMAQNIWFDETFVFLYGMAHEDVSVRFYFGIEDFAFLVNVREEACRRIPGVEDSAGEIHGF